ncbi:MAG TPA: peptide-methionine (S)-S-oxide reductase [Eudoraea sp.]|nr:peptide-methionine (S)-S-oxide reductase [Eudoraea sp.]
MSDNGLLKIALGGGCHWCTEAVFQSLSGVVNVEQGYVSSIGDNKTFSEGVVVHFDVAKITLSTLVKVHLHTHKSTSEHSMRRKYRSAIYTFSKEQATIVGEIFKQVQPVFKDPIITKILPFRNFRPSESRYLNYYLSNPEKPFCENHITPKMAKLGILYGGALKH